MKSPLQTLVRDFGWIHTGIGLIGNFTFLVGSVFFLPSFEAWQTFGVWLFIVGSGLMFVGSAGDLMLKIYEAREKAARDRANAAAVQASRGRQPASASQAPGNS